MRKKVSVIVPIYNTAEYLPKCLDSVLHQSFGDFELILVNDGSTDESGELCRVYAQRDERIRLLEQSNQGLSASRNRGLAAAKGEYICFLDSDDYWETDMLDTMLRIIAEKDADIGIFGYIQHENGRDKLFCSHPALVDGKECVKRILQDDSIGNYAWNKVFKRELLDGFVFPIGVIYEDVRSIYQVLLKSRRIIITDQAFYHYCKRTDSLSKAVNLRNAESLYQAACEREEALLKLFPELSREITANRILFAINSWNLLCRMKETSGRKKNAHIAQDIRQHREILRELPFSRRIMGYFICFNSELYSCLVRLLRRKSVTEKAV